MDDTWNAIREAEKTFAQSTLVTVPMNDTHTWDTWMAFAATNARDTVGSDCFDDCDEYARTYLANLLAYIDEAETA